ncbi:MAG: hemerythrin domain-containing protein [Pseudomonadota bacterium]
MAHDSVRIIHEEHAALAAMLQSLRMMIQRGPGDAPEQFFDVLRAMLFYIDEFPERQHHPKESSLLFPPLRTRAPHLQGTLERLERDHDHGEAAVRELQHLLLAWELLGESRRSAFEVAMLRHLDFYLEHMRVEETEVLPEAVRHLTPQDWAALDAAFATNQDPLTGKYPRDPLYDRLFTRIVMRTPAPIGVGAG